VGYSVLGAGVVESKEDLHQQQDEGGDSKKMPKLGTPPSDAFDSQKIINGTPISRPKMAPNSDGPRLGLIWYMRKPVT
jgi:hypothetical protein